MAIGMLLAGCDASVALPPEPAGLFVKQAEPAWGGTTDAAAMRAVETAARQLEPRFGRVSWRSEHGLRAADAPALFAHYRSAAQAGGWTPIALAPLGKRGRLDAWHKGDAMFGVLHVASHEAVQPVLLLVNDRLARRLPTP